VRRILYWSLSLVIVTVILAGSASNPSDSSLGSAVPGGPPAIGGGGSPPGVLFSAETQGTLALLRLGPTAGGTAGEAGAVVARTGADAAAMGPTDASRPPSPETDLPEAERRPRVVLYTIKSGDTLWDIAQDYGIEVVTILGANPDLSPTRLEIGRTIRVLTVDGVLHLVQEGETVADLAESYEVAAAAITEANSLPGPGHIAAGAELIIPGARPSIVHNVKVGSQTVAIYGSFQWPVSGYITSYYGWRWGRFHHGIDIGAPHGRSIQATRAGKVVFAGWKGGYGYAVVIDHGDGLTSLYGHASSLLVSYGQWVEAGQVIARIGSTGYSTGPHLHFELAYRGQTFNPLEVLP